MKKHSILLTLAIAIASSSAALAVKPGTWLHRAEADFATGEAENAIVTNLGEVQLARATKQIAELGSDDSIIYDIARVGDRTFVAVGPVGKLAVVNGEGIETIADYAGAQVFAIAAAKNGLWVAVSGAPSRLELREGKDMKVTRTVELKDTRYIWDIAQVDDRVYLATGTEGKVLMLKGDADEPVIALDTKQSSILCLGVDEQKRIYAGTDTEGLVYRLTPKGDDDFEPFVLYDAAEPEIGALLVLPGGTVYAGTADAEQARPGRLEEALTEVKGRPEIPAQDKPVEIPNLPPSPEPKDDNAGETKQSRTPPFSDAGKGEEPSAEGEPKPDQPVTADAGKPKPTPEQYDALRQAVRERLAQAQQSGRIKLQASNSGSSNGPSISQRLRSRVTSNRNGNGNARGNAVYRIEPDGFVSEVFRESVMILRLVGSGDMLLVGTGNEGELYRVSPGEEEVTTLGDLEPQQIPAMLDLGEGQVLIGTANPGRLISVATDFAEEGMLTSEPLDARQISLFGRLQVTAATPNGTSIAVQTRSGNVADTDAGTWSPWSEPTDLAFNGGRSAYVEVTSPAARYLQYRLVLRSKGDATPSVNSIALKYLMPNVQPRIASITTEYNGGNGKGKNGSTAAPAPRTELKVRWEASDGNEDALTYRLEVTPFGSDAPWIELADDLTGTDYDWNTRTMPDGRYFLRVTASDEADNPPGIGKSATRRSDPVVVDNTPPSLAEVAVKQAGDGAIQLTADVSDALSPIAEVRYVIDSGEEWQLVLPEDLIYDSTGESIDVRITGLSPGRHVVTVRAMDVLNNSAYVSQTFEVK